MRGRGERFGGTISGDDGGINLTSIDLFLSSNLLISLY